MGNLKKLKIPVMVFSNEEVRELIDFRIITQSMGNHALKNEALFPVLYWPDKTKDVAWAWSETWLLQNELENVRKSANWEDVKDQYWEPEDGEFCWFWNNANDRIAAYYHGMSSGSFVARLTRDKQNGSFAKQFSHVRTLTFDLEEVENVR